MVAMCEEGGWGTYAEGQSSYGSLGLSAAAWDEFGSMFDRTAASPDEQILVATNVSSSAPDQGGCTSW
jgi:hypothetical protein